MHELVKPFILRAIAVLLSESSDSFIIKISEGHLYIMVFSKTFLQGIDVEISNDQEDITKWHFWFVSGIIGLLAHLLTHRFSSHSQNGAIWYLIG